MLSYKNKTDGPVKKKICPYFIACKYDECLFSKPTNTSIDDVVCTEPEGQLNGGYWSTGDPAFHTRKLYRTTLVELEE